MTIYTERQVVCNTCRWIGTRGESDAHQGCPKCDSEDIALLHLCSHCGNVPVPHQNWACDACAQSLDTEPPPDPQDYSECEVCGLLYDSSQNFTGTCKSCQ